MSLFADEEIHHILHVFSPSRIEPLTCHFQQYGILTSVDSHKPVQPLVKLRNCIVCSASSFTVIEYPSNQQKALISLRVCTALLVVQTTLLEISFSWLN